MELVYIDADTTMNQRNLESPAAVNARSNYIQDRFRLDALFKI